MGRWHITGVYGVLMKVQMHTSQKSDAHQSKVRCMSVKNP